MKTSLETSVEAFIAALRMLIKTCDICDNGVTSILHDQIVFGGYTKTQTQAEMLKVRELQRCIDVCKLMENAAQHSRIFRPEQVQKIATKTQKSLLRKSKLGKESRFCILAMNQERNIVQLMEKLLGSAEARIILQQNESR